MIKTEFTTTGYNHGVPIGVKSAPYISGKHTEANSIMNAFGGDGTKVYMGLLKLLHQYDELPTPILNMTELNKAVLEVPTFGSTLVFDVPYKKGWPMVKAKIVDVTVSKPGRGGIEYAPIVLSEDCYTNNDIITNNLRDGIQARIHPTEPVVPFAQGSGFLYLITAATDSPDEFIPHEALEPGQRWCKIGHRSGELSTSSSAVSNYQRSGIMSLAHKTANSIFSIKHSITSYADVIDVDTLASNNRFPALYNYKNMSASDSNAITEYYNLGPDGKSAVKGSGAWGPTIVNKMLLELAMMKEYSLTWAKSFSFVDAGGKTTTVPKGYYQWIKQHGHYRTYNTTRELPNLMKNVVSQLFADRKGLPLDKRKVKFKMGLAAMIEVQKEWMQQFKSENPFLIINDGRNPFLEGLLTGTVQNLSYKPARIVAMHYPEVGSVEIEHMPALDYMDEGNDIQRHVGQYPLSSYSIFVEDISSDSFSNSVPKGATWNVAGSANFDNGSNVVLIKPKNFYDTVDFLPGTGCNPTLKKFLGRDAMRQTAVSEARGFTVIAQTTGEIFIKDPSRIMLIEMLPQL